MTASLWPSGLRVSGLTLSLYKDTGFYAEVDTTTYAEDIQYGKGNGCTFAQGGGTAAPEYCTGSASACDFNSVYKGTCSASDTFADGTKYIVTDPSYTCTYPSDASSAPSQSWGPESRCVVVNSNPNCYASTCNSAGT